MTYQKEQNKLLQNYLDRYEKHGNKSVELIISSECNQSCEYCYIFKHGHKMYPPEANDKNNILTNLKILLKYLEDSGYDFCDYDIFSGEFFDLSYWEDIFNIFYDFYKDKHHKDKDFMISIPTNGSFLFDIQKTEKIEEWINKFKTINFYIFLSLSVDGPQNLENKERPLKKDIEKKDDIFYDRLFNFMGKYYYTTHPMITKEFVKNYKQNYDFWIDNIKKYNVIFKKHNGEEALGIPMFLEVRDANQWDNIEALQNYEKFLWYVAEKDLKDIHNNNLEEFALHMADDFSDLMRNSGKYCSVQPYIIGLPNSHTKIPCSIQGGSVIRVGDLAIVPCHRTCYPNLVYGNYIVENGVITGVKAKNPMLAYKIKNFNPNRSMLKCTNCELRSFCMKGCLGAQLETNKELFSPIESLCDLFKIKYRTINEIAKYYGVYDIIKNHIKIPLERKEYIENARKIIERSCY